MRRRKKTGELEFFKQIWESLKPFQRVSFVSGIPIRTFSPVNFHHVLVKGKYPEFRLDERNIVLLTFDEHRMVDNIARSDLEMRPGWGEYFKYYDSLIELANEPRETAIDD